jgi:hypothetical protein
MQMHVSAPSLPDLMHTGITWNCPRRMAVFNHRRCAFCCCVILTVGKLCELPFGVGG